MEINFDDLDRFLEEIVPSKSSFEKLKKKTAEGCETLSRNVEELKRVKVCGILEDNTASKVNLLQPRLKQKINHF